MMPQDTLKVKPVTGLQRPASDNVAPYVIFNADTGGVCKVDNVLEVLHYISDTSFCNSLQEVQSFSRFFINASETFRKKTFIEYSSRLKEGAPIHRSEIKSDWMLPVVVVSALLYLFLRNLPGYSLQMILRYITLRGITDSVTRETAKIFRLQSLIFNIVTFINISLAGLIAIDYLRISNPETSKLIIWTVFFAGILLFYMGRIMIINLTGILSEETRLFSEYKLAVQNFYRITGLICFFITVAVLYTKLLPANYWLTAGFTFVSMLYLLRLLRLVMIFAKSRVSFLYLILYLCAVEILPVAVLIKFFTGLLQNFI